MGKNLKFFNFLTLKFNLFMKKHKNKNTNQKTWIWPIKILILAIFLSFGFSVISEFALTGASIAVSIIVIVIFIVVSIFFDMLGLATASASIENFNAMASRKVKGSKQGILLVKNADKVSSICADVIGDVCGILAGAAGASILAKLALSGAEYKTVLIASLISAIIAALTIFGKASFKRFSINHADAITLKFAKIINIFTRKG